jgi:hypothetical protein
MVEAPGTAPGSETLMSRGVYRHSRLPDTANIGVPTGFLKVSSSLCHCIAHVATMGRSMGRVRLGKFILGFLLVAGAVVSTAVRLEHHASLRLASACALP